MMREVEYEPIRDGKETVHTLTGKTGETVKVLDVPMVRITNTTSCCLETTGNFKEQVMVVKNEIGPVF